MADILETIISHKRLEVAEALQQTPYAALERQVEAQKASAGCVVRSMSQAIQQSASGIIAEFKRKSPSKGWIHPDADAAVIPPAYAANGAAALSILTDEAYFGGTADDLMKARQRIASTPILRKDFIIDEYQILQARLMGADAILLIAAALTPEECRRFARFAHDLRLQTLLEVHSESEIGHLNEDIDMIGVNNRHLGTFHTDVENSFRLASSLPEGLPWVAESGIKDAATIRQLRAAGFRGFLIGETLMRGDDPAAALRTLIHDIISPRS